MVSGQYICGRLLLSIARLASPIAECSSRVQHSLHSTQSLCMIALADLGRVLCIRGTRTAACGSLLTDVAHSAC